MQGSDSKPQCPVSQLIVRVDNPYTYNHSVLTQQVCFSPSGFNKSQEGVNTL